MGQTHILRIRTIDKIVFDLIKNGQKIIETRAATPNNISIKIGDKLIFVYGKQKISKTVAKVNKFKTISGLTRQIRFKRVMPWVKSIQEMKQVYYSFPGYRLKIKKYGLVAFKLK